jgi:ribonuclease BN (tRNA processing enzyme)
MSSDDVDVVFISHFHADHFFGLPFLMLDAWRNRRVHELVIVGPPGIAQRTEDLFETAFPGLPNFETLKRRYIEISDGLEAEAAGLAFTAVAVDHVPNLDCFAFRVQHRGRSLVYSGDACLCDGLRKIVPGADVVVVECSCSGDVVHLSAAGVEEVRRHAPEAQFVVTHLDGHDHPDGFRGLHVASDLARFKF